MKTQRRFRPEFKCQVIEELLSGISSPAQIIRRYDSPHCHSPHRQIYFPVLAAQTKNLA